MVLKVGAHIEVLRDDGVPTRVIFDKVPENLRARPTLSILVASEQAGRRPAALRYMTTGLTWKADYVADFDEQAKTVDLQGWVTLTNTTDVAYENAKVRVASGAVSAGSLMQPQYGDRYARPDATTNASVTLFDLPEPVTIADRQAKQIGTVDLKGVTAEKVYRSVWRKGPGTSFFSGTAQPAKAEVVLRFQAKDGGGTEWRLPRGALRAFIRETKGETQFVGETQIPDVAAGGDITASISRAFDIDVTPRLVSTQKLGPDRTRNSVEFKVANTSDADVAVEIELGGLGADVRAADESVAGVALDAFRRQWTVNVPAHGQTILSTVLEQSP